MRRAHRLALALAGVLLISASAGRAADGIKASATASREVPADILVVSFPLTERIGPGASTEREITERGLRTVPVDVPGGPVDVDQRSMLAKALEKNGLKVLSRSTRYMPNAGGYAAHQSVSSTGIAPGPVDVRRHVTFRVTGFKRIDDVLEVLGRHGVRQNVSLSADHSRAEAVREELRKEAIEGAIAQARRLAARAGVKTGGVVDLVTQPPIGPGAWSTAYPYHGVMGTDQNLIDARQPGELPRLRFTVTASIVLAIKPD